MMDTASFNFIYSQEAIAEIDRYFESKEAFLDPRGGLQHANSDLIEWVALNMTA